MAEKEVKLKITTETDMGNVEDLEDKLKELQSEKLTLQVQADMAELEEINGQIEDTKSKLSDLKAKVDVDNSEIELLESELEELKTQRLELEVNTDDEELDELNSEIEKTQTKLDELKADPNVDDSEIEALEDKLDELESEKLELTVEADSSELEELDSQIEETQSKLESLQASVAVDDSEIQSLEDELTELENRQIDLEIAVTTAELDEAKASMDDLEASSQNTASSIDGVGSALTAVAGAAGLDQMVTTADNINNSWNRLSLTFAGTGTSIDQLKQKQADLAASTGQTGGAIRDYFNQMGIAGVTNVDLLGSSFEALSGKAYQTGQSVEQMESKFQRMVMTGNASSRMLTSLGISAQDLANAMGVSADQVSEAFKNMTPEERIQALTKAMGDGKQANEMYKNSFQGLKTQAEAAFAGLMGAVGQAILPVVIPMLNMAKDAITGLTNAFKSLPGPVQAIIGGLGGVAMAAVTIIGTLGVVGQLVSTVKNGIQALTGIMRIWEAVTKMVELAQAALNLVMSMNPIFLVVIAIVALITILWYLYNTNESVRNAIDGLGQGLMNLGQTIYGYLVGAFEYLQGAWQNTVNFFQSGINNIVSFFNPLIVTVHSIMQVFDLFASGQLTVEQALWGVINAFRLLLEPIGQAILNITGLGEVWQFIVDLFNSGGQSIWDTLTGVFTGIYDTITGTLGSAFQWLTDSFNLVVTTFQTYAPLIAQALFVMATGGIGAIVLLLANMNGMPNQVGAILQRVISSIISFVTNMVSQFTNGARNAVSNFASGISGLTSAMTGELNRMLGAVGSWISQVISRFYNAGVEFVNALKRGMGIGSPGHMFYMMETELGRIEHIVKDNNIPTNVQKLGTNIVDAFGDNNGLSLNGNSTGITSTGSAGTVNYTFNLYGDIDNEDRMQKFIDAVIRELEWDNAVAGRNTNFGA